MYTARRNPERKVHTLARKFEAVHSTTTTNSKQMPSVRLARPIPTPLRVEAEEVITMITNLQFQ